MKFWKHSLFSAAAFLTIAGSVLYTSCEKDPCSQLSCKNGGSCADGFCRCPTGYEGAECATKTADRFLGTYVGYSRCGENPNLVDTLDVRLQAQPNILAFSLRNRGNSAGTGTASGYEILVNDDPQQNTNRFVNLVVDGKKITFFDEHVYDGTNGNKEVCQFVGYRQ